MSNWKVPLPKGDPPKGRCYFRMAMKSPSGVRMELDGAIKDGTFNEFIKLQQKHAIKIADL